MLIRISVLLYDSVKIPYNVEVTRGGRATRQEVGRAASVLLGKCESKLGLIDSCISSHIVICVEGFEHESDAGDRSRGKGTLGARAGQVAEP